MVRWPCEWRGEGTESQRWRQNQEHQSPRAHHAPPESAAEPPTLISPPHPIQISLLSQNFINVFFKYIYTKISQHFNNKNKNSVIKHQIDLIRELWIGNLNLDNTSGMAEAMASNVVSENQVISGRRYSIILFVNPHFFFFWFQILCASDDRFFKDNNRGRE